MTIDYEADVKIMNNTNDLLWTMGTYSEMMIYFNPIVGNVLNFAHDEDKEMKVDGDRIAFYNRGRFNYVRIIVTDTDTYVIVFMCQENREAALRGVFEHFADSAQIKETSAAAAAEENEDFIETQKETITTRVLDILFNKASGLIMEFTQEIAFEMLVDEIDDDIDSIVETMKNSDSLVLSIGGFIFDFTLKSWLENRIESKFENYWDAKGWSHY